LNLNIHGVAVAKNIFGAYPRMHGSLPALRLRAVRAEVAARDVSAKNGGNMTEIDPVWRISESGDDDENTSKKIDFF